MALNIDLQFFAQAIDTSACLTFTGETSDFTLKATYKEWDGIVEYATDSTDWTTWDGSEISSVDKKLYLRGSGNTTFCTSTNYGVYFILSARAACSGNIQTLLQYNNPPIAITGENCYRSMFDGCANLTQAPELPAIGLASCCYYRMFKGCTSLTQAPELPATTLAFKCYEEMFYNCTNLTQVPELPATTLTAWCYGYMFCRCTSLTQAPELPATALAHNCYTGMFCKCSALKISETKNSDCLAPWRIPSKGRITSYPSQWNLQMFTETPCLPGGLSGISANTTYYGGWPPIYYFKHYKLVDQD